MTGGIGYSRSIGYGHVVGKWHSSCGFSHSIGYGHVVVGRVVVTSGGHVTVRFRSNNTKAVEVGNPGQHEGYHKPDSLTISAC
jgi:hypothetical protein